MTKIRGEEASEPAASGSATEEACGLVRRARRSPVLRRMPQQLMARLTGWSSRRWDRQTEKDQREQPS
ncbi:hypothetical protein Vse01_22570 [Micromonospora sediminimaris]|uniref:Uncharacterized protein n=1 Tax=Micromonospora sediminimaris TaxID=547162 RepID=A0A9W5XJN7_9ACTN|nr:hypothetical protein Vse01_22570 [Micromonospora sediminimaris]